jgi:phenylalanyl-tRNA synthetase beta chain
MLLSYRWLCAMLGQDPGLERVCQALTQAGVEVESVRDLGAGSGKVVAARILTRDKHPNADKLSLCDVDAGPVLGQKRIVCGAQNMGPGDVVPLAIEGAVLPGNFVIKKSKIRGESSEGMMCSGRELGLGEDHSGLLLLPSTDDDSGPYGAPLFPIGSGFEAILEVKPTPNRGDCLSMRGLVREVRAGLGLAEGSQPESTLPSLGLGSEQAVQADGGRPCPVTVEVEDTNACSRYLGRVIRGVTIGPSPRWLQRVLETAGLRPISNVVDITNLILLECGQPLHAFDLSKLRGGRITVRCATEGEPLATLDGQQVKLTPRDLVIADAEGPVALAGVMGGEGSSISETTTDLFLECALFDPSVIRHTSRRLGKVTDSSQRFERGIDTAALATVIDRATQLILALAGGHVEGAVADCRGIIPAAAVLLLDLDQTSAFLGIELETEEAVAILSRLEFGVVAREGRQLTVQVPSHRHDVTRPVDLAEELARVAGYDRIPSLPPQIQSRAFQLPPSAAAARRLRQVLVQAGLCEASCLSLVSPEWLNRTGFGEFLPAPLPLRNALSADLSVLRHSLIPGLLSVAAYNQNHGAESIRLFEIGRVFHAGTNQASPVQEPWHLVALLSGTAGDGAWRPVTRGADFFDAKGLVEVALSELGWKADVVFAPLPAEGLVGLVPGGLLHPGKAAVVSVGGKVVGAVGELHPGLLASVGLRRAPQLVVLDVAAVAERRSTPIAVKPISEFPGVTRDLALMVPQSVAASEVERAIRRKGKPLLESLRLFDIYEGKGVPEGHRSLGYALHFVAPDRTLRDEDVQQAVDAVLSELAPLGVGLRGVPAA